MFKDLQRGHEGEKQLISILEQAGMSCQSNRDVKKLSDFDVIATINDREITFEVKNDLYASKSGNIAIEVFNPKSKKPSGLTITKADFWCHITDGIYILTVQKLRQFVQKNKPKRIIPVGGDDNATLYLYKKDILLQKFFRINDISKTDLLTYLNTGV